METEFKFIEAAAGGRPRVCGIAYSGGKMKPCGFSQDVVVDLSGMTIPESIPLLANHENRTGCRVGMITASIKNGTLEITGEVFSESAEAKDIVAQAKAGASWQLSIGADIQKADAVKAGCKKEINGQSFDGPFYHVVNSVLREVSVVAVGADVSTVMKIAASFNLNQGEESMSSEKEDKVVAAAPAAVEASPVQEVQAASAPEITSEQVRAAADNAALQAVKAERQRAADIRSVCAGEFPEIEAEAISAGYSVDETRVKVLAALRARKPETSINISVKNDQADAKTLEASLALRAGISEADCLKAYGEQTLDMANDTRDIALRDLMMECARMEGKTVGRSFDNEAIQAAFSTVSLPNILSNVAHKALQKAYAAQPIIATKLCSSGDLVDFKEADRLRLTDVGDLVPVAPDGEIKEGGLTEEKATNQLDTYGKKFCLTRKMIINDDLGAFMQVPTQMGNRAARLIDQLFFKRLLSNPTQGDGVALFHANHRNLETGSTSALSKAALEKAIGKFIDQVDADGQPITVEPKYLLVPTGLKFTAQELVHGATLITGANGELRPALNTLVNENLQVVTSPYLANSNYTGYSTTAWYLFGDANQVETFEIGYLKGKRTPTVEKGETDFNTLGIWFRVFFDVGVREQGFRGIVKSVGA